MIAASTHEATTRDAAAFVALVEPVLPAAYRLAVAMLRSQPDAEDAVQEATSKAWRHFARFRAGAEMKPWLLAIVANECRRQRRARWVALADGIVISLTCLGLVLGIPIIVAAARAPLGRPASPDAMPTAS